jgi:lipopolysaccharide export system protein LptA
MRLPSLAAALVAIAATRPIAAEPAVPSTDPLGMSADKLDLDVEAHTALLTGHVELRRGTTTLRCARVEVRYDESPKVLWARGSGGVEAEVKGVRVTAPEVEIDLAARALTLKGGVRMAHGEGWISADRATVDMASGKVSMTEVKGSLPLPAPAPAP